MWCMANVSTKSQTRLLTSAVDERKNDDRENRDEITRMIGELRELRLESDSLIIDKRESISYDHITLL